MPNTKKIALSSIFSVLTLAVMGFVPAPTSDYLIAFQSFFLALSFLLVGAGGATYVGLVTGLLITAVKIAFFPYDLVFSFGFGLLTDALGVGLKAKVDSTAKTLRLVVAMMGSTGVIGFVAYYVTAVATNRVPNEFFLDLTVLIFGVVSGAIGGFAAGRLWNTTLRARFQNYV